MFKYFLLLSLTIIAGCSSINTGSKPVPLINYIDQNITEKDAKFIANDLVFYLRDPLPPASTTLIVKSNDSQDLFTSSLVSVLQHNGYGVLYTDQPEASQKNGINLTYKVMPMEDGVVLIARYDLTEITRYYVHSSKGDIVPSSSFSIRINDGSK